VGGNDVITGGNGNDALHGGAGNDTINGNGDLRNDPTHAAMNAMLSACALDPLQCDKDAVFGDNGNDILWGGPDRDHVFGGYGSDHLDVITPTQGDYTTDFKGADILYGGWDSDFLESDKSQPNPNGVDKLIDAQGVYNTYYICESAYGGNSVIRLVDSSMATFIQNLAQADGALNPATKNSSGFNEASVVFSGDVKANSSPPAVDTPGSGVCDPNP